MEAIVTGQPGFAILGRNQQEKLETKLTVRRSFSMTCERNSPTPEIFGRVRAASGLSSCVGRERDSPETSGAKVLLRKFDSVGMNASRGTHLGDNSSRNLRAPFISHQDGRTHDQFASDRDSGTKLVQVRGFGGHRKCLISTVLARQPDRCIESNATASALCDSTGTDRCSCHEFL